MRFLLMYIWVSTHLRKVCIMRPKTARICKKSAYDTKSNNILACFISHICKKNSINAYACWTIKCLHNKFADKLCMPMFHIWDRFFLLHMRPFSHVWLILVAYMRSFLQMRLLLSRICRCFSNVTIFSRMDGWFTCEAVFFCIWELEKESYWSTAVKPEEG